MNKELLEQYKSKIIDGKKIASDYRNEIKDEVASMKEKPSLAVIIVGNDPASEVYVRNKEKACIEAGMTSLMFRLSAETTEEQLLAQIAELNDNKDVDGILVQMPLPRRSDGTVINDKAVIAAIAPDKDVDAFRTENVGHIMIGDHTMLPCTPAGVMVLLERSGVSIEGKECLVIGRSNIVGKPMAMLLLHANGTVTVAHSRSENLAELCGRADILVAAVGKANMIKGDMIKPGAVLIDVGMNRDEDGKLCGDIDFDSCAPVCGKITPVPGGVGPMTISMLLRNTLTSARLRGKE